MSSGGGGEGGGGGGGRGGEGGGGGGEGGGGEGEGGVEEKEGRKRRREEGIHTCAVGNPYIPVCVLTAKRCYFAELIGLPREVQTFPLLCRITEYHI